MYEMALTGRVHQQFHKLSLAEKDSIEAALDRLSANPRPPGIRKIYGNIYRIRIGDWRVIYAVYDKDKLVLVGKIARRSEDTYERMKGLF